MAYADTVREHLTRQALAAAKAEVAGLGLFAWPQAAGAPNAEPIALDLPEVSIEAEAAET
jgi:hypothetical protein